MRHEQFRFNISLVLKWWSCFIRHCSRADDLWLKSLCITSASPSQSWIITTTSTKLRYQWGEERVWHGAKTLPVALFMFPVGASIHLKHPCRSFMIKTSKPVDRNKLNNKNYCPTEWSNEWVKLDNEDHPASYETTAKLRENWSRGYF